MKLSSGARAMRGSPLRGLRCELSGDISQLVLLPHHQAGRLTHPEGSRASLSAGASPPKLYRMLGHAFSRGRSFIRVRLPPPKYIPAGAVMISGFALDALAHPHKCVGGSPWCRKRKPALRRRGYKKFCTFLNISDVSSHSFASVSKLAVAG